MFYKMSLMVNTWFNYITKERMPCCVSTNWVHSLHVAVMEINVIKICVHLGGTVYCTPQKDKCSALKTQSVALSHQTLARE